MNAFPLAPFFYALISDGVAVSFGDYDRISIVLRTGDKWTRTRLRGVLTALLAHNKEEAERIQRRFDAYFIEQDSEEFSDEDVRRCLQLLREAAVGSQATNTSTEAENKAIASGSTETPTSEPKSFWTTRRLISIVAVVVVFSAGLIWFLRKDDTISNPGSAGTGGQVTASPQPTAEPGATPGPRSGASPLPLNVMWSRPRAPAVGKIQVDAIDPVQTIPLPRRWRDLWMMLGTVLVLLGFCIGISALISRALRDPALQFDPKQPRLFPFSRVGDPAPPQLSGPALDCLADSINYFLSSRPSQRLDINSTIRETGRNAGMPALQYYRQRQVRRVCIFEDSRSDALIWNRVTSELMEGLSKRGVEVMFARFVGDLDQFVMQDGRTYWLDDLDNEKRDSLFLFFSDGKHIGNRDIFALERLARLPLVAWFDFREPRFWDETALLIKTYGIPLYQANADGLIRAFDRFLMESASEADDTDAVRHWRGFPPFTEGQLAVYIEHLLGDSLVWAQACSMIQPISLNMAHSLRKEFQAHLPFERIERLFRLPGTTLQASCLRFSRPVMAALRGGFAARLSAEEQNAILVFIQQHIRRLEPPKSEKSLRRLAWEWTLRRVELESTPDEVLPVLSQLSQTPLGSEIRSDLFHLVFLDQAVPSGDADIAAVPLRTRPVTTQGVAYLREFSPHIVMSNSLRKKFFLNWHHLQYVLKRLFRYVWLQISELKKRSLKAFRVKTVESEAQASRIKSPEGRIVADPPELTIKHVLVGQKRRCVINFRTTEEVGLAGRIVSDNEWLKPESTYCDGQHSTKAVSVLIDAGKLSVGNHVGNITFLPADNSYPVDVSINVQVHRSWKYLAIDWWRENRPKHPLRAMTVATLIVIVLTFLTFKVLPANWFNRIYNRPPGLQAITPVFDADLPDNMLALEAITDDADSDTMQYIWRSDWGTIIGDWRKPILVGSTSEVPQSVTLGLFLIDGRGGYRNFSTRVQLHKAKSYLPYSDNRYRYGPSSNRYVREYREAYELGVEWARTDLFEHGDVRLLLTRLQADDARERWLAANSLGHVTVARKEVLPHLIKSLNEPDSTVLEAIIQALARFESEEAASGAVTRVIGFLKSDPRVNARIAAARALVGFKRDHNITVPVLLEALSDENEDVRNAAAFSLGRISNAKDDLLRRLTDPTTTSGVKRLAAVALSGRAMETSDPEIASALIRVLDSRENGAELRRTAAYALAELTPTDAETVNAIIKHLADDSYQVRTAVVSALWSITREPTTRSLILPALLNSLKDSHAEVRKTVIGALGNFRPEPDDFEIKLVESLKDPDAEVRRVVLDLLAKLSIESTQVPQLLAMLKDPASPRADAARALGRIRHKDPSPVVDALKATLTDLDLELSRASAYSLAALASSNEKATGALIDYLTSPDAHLKNAAISGIWDVMGRNLPQNAIEANRERINDALVQALTDGTSFVRANAAIVLGISSRPGNDGTVSALTSMVLNEREGNVASAALDGLATMENFCSKLPEFRKSRFIRVRIDVLDAMTNYPCWSELEQFIPTVMESLGDYSPQVRSMAFNALMEYAVHIHYRQLGFTHSSRFMHAEEFREELYRRSEELLKSSDFKVRLLGLEVLRRAPGLRVSREQVISRLAKLLNDEDPRVRQRVVLELWEIDGESHLAGVNDEDLRVQYTIQAILIAREMTSIGFYELHPSDRATLNRIIDEGDPLASSIAERALQFYNFIEARRQRKKEMSEY